MIISLLSPLMLAVTPVALTDIAPSVYDHGSQRTIVQKGSEYSQTAQFRTTTWNGTQTYGYDGRPNDADNDTD